MRWLSKQDGDTRIRRGFLLSPRRIAGETRWLEWAVWEQELLIGKYHHWIDRRWLN